MLWEWGVAKPNRLAFNLTGGRLGGRIGRAPILVLHHVGRKSGQARTSPLIYLPDGDDRYVIVASKGGVDRHPAWFHNLIAAPDTEVEVPRRGRVPVRARRASTAEADDLWPRLYAIWPLYRSYRRNTEREIPLVVLERR